MDSLTILNEVYNSLQAERVKTYDDLNRLLSNPKISPQPVLDAKCLISAIADIERKQEVAIFFNKQLTKIEEKGKLENQEEKQEEKQEDETPEDQ